MLHNWVVGGGSWELWRAGTAQQSKQTDNRTRPYTRSAGIWGVPICRRISGATGRFPPGINRSVLSDQADQANQARRARLVERDLKVTATPAPARSSVMAVNSAVPAAPVSGSWVMLLTFFTL